MLNSYLPLILETQFRLVSAEQKLKFLSNKWKKILIYTITKWIRTKFEACGIFFGWQKENKQQIFKMFWENSSRAQVV